jgi:hypothetical protein
MKYPILLTTLVLGLTLLSGCEFMDRPVFKNDKVSCFFDENGKHHNNYYCTDNATGQVVCEYSYNKGENPPETCFN